METRLNSRLSSSRSLETSHEPQISSKLMSSLSKMRTGTSERSAAEFWPIPMECGKVKSKNKEQRTK